MRAEVRGSKAQLRKRDPRRLFRGGHFLAALTLPKTLGKSETKTTMEGHFCFPNCTGSHRKQKQNKTRSSIPVEDSLTIKMKTYKTLKGTVTKNKCKCPYQTL